jgi:hypothetical protein
MSSEDRSRGRTDLEPASARPETEDFAGEIRVAGGKPPRWSTLVPYVAIVLALAYYLYVRATDPVNLVFATLFLFWLIYTPIAKRRGWFFIPMG